MLCLKSWLKLWMLLPSRIERKTCDFALKSCQFNSCFPQAVYAGYWLVIASRSSLQIKLMWKALVIFLFSFWEGATSWLFASTVKMDSWRTLKTNADSYHRARFKNKKRPRQKRYVLAYLAMKGISLKWPIFQLCGGHEYLTRNSQKCSYKFISRIVGTHF